MIRGTTPTITLKIPSRDLRECDIVVTIQNARKTIHKNNEEMDIEYNNGTLLSITLSQEETLSFAEGKASVQVNWLYPTGNREATTIADAYIGKNLYGWVMKNE